LIVEIIAGTGWHIIHFNEWTLLKYTPDSGTENQSVLNEVRAVESAIMGTIPRRYAAVVKNP
jgi:hypothetical protein